MPVEAIRIGDKFTIAGYYEIIRNPGRRWWQWWKPAHVNGSSLKQWTVAAHLPNTGYIAQ